MWVEAWGIVLCVLLMGLIGLGPSLWAAQPGERRALYALGLAPAIGYLVLCILGFPLVRFVAPVRAWAWPVTIVLGLASLALAAREWRRAPIVAGWGPVVGAVLVLLVCYGLLVGPMLVYGIQYTIFRSTPNDALNYISIAETLRVASWRTLMGGLDFADLEGLRRLAEAAPMAPAIVNMMWLPLAVNKEVLMAWGAQVTGVSAERFYYADLVVAYLVAATTALVVGDRLKLARPFKVLAAAGVALGFWARFVLETDAAHEVSSIPLLMLVTAAWMQLEDEGGGWRWRSRLLLAGALAGIVCIYEPLGLIVALALAGYYGWGLLQGVKRPVELAQIGLTFGLTALLLALTGQIDYLVRSTLHRIAYVEYQENFPPIVLNVLRTDGVSAVWGLPDSVLGLLAPAGTLGPLVKANAALALFLSLALAATGWYVLKRSAPSAERIVFAVLGAGLVVLVGLVARGNLRSAGKGLTYVYPYLPLGLLVFTKYMGWLFQPPLQRASLALLSVWLLAYVGLGASVPYLGRAPGGIFKETDAYKHQNFDVSAVARYLDQHPPELLLVNIPRASSSWTFAWYVMFTLEPYPTYYQSGLPVYDPVPKLWLETLPRAPDYAVTLKAADYIGPNGWGVQVAETPDLLLYRITVSDVAVFNEMEHQLYGEEQKGNYSSVEGE